MVVLAVVLLVGFPLWVLCALLADVVLGIHRIRCVRVLTFVTFMSWFEIFTLGKALGTYLRTLGRVRVGYGQLHLQRLVGFYVHGILAATSKLLGLRMHVTGTEVFDDGAGLICFGHHTSILDSVVPVEILSHRMRYEIRFVIKKSLSWAPVFDTAGHWLPVHFVDRTGRNSNEETAAIANIASDITPRSAAAMYPEGTFYTPKRLDRAVARLETQAPELVERAKKLRHVLPPRPGGALAMLEADAKADVVLIVHSGFEPFVNLAKIFANVPFRRPVHVHMWRVPRSEVPTDDKEAYVWLFDRFEEMDSWVEEKLALPITSGKKR